MIQKWENEDCCFQVCDVVCGFTLLGGEKQRIALARTILKNPPLLFFDEATSALDTNTERSLLSAIRRLMGHKHATSLFVAHRLRTIVDADRIFVLDKGQVVEEGTHKMLMKHGGVYEEMWHSQELEEAEQGMTQSMGV